MRTDYKSDVSPVQVYYFDYRFSEGNQIPIPFTFLSKNICFSNMKRCTKISFAEVKTFQILDASFGNLKLPNFDGKGFIQLEIVQNIS